MVKILNEEQVEYEKGCECPFCSAVRMVTWMRDDVEMPQDLIVEMMLDVLRGVCSSVTIVSGPVEDGTLH